MIQPYAFLANDDFTNRRKSCRGSAIPRINLKLWAEAPEKPSQFSAAADNLLPPLQENTDEDKENTVDQDDHLIEEWVKGKEEAEAIAVELAKDYIEETPKPIDQSNYLQALTEEGDLDTSAWFNTILESSLDSESGLKARKINSGNIGFDKFVSELESENSQKGKNSDKLYGVDRLIR